MKVISELAGSSMLSSFFKFMNRERALSFSAALCLLTVIAAALPGMFQEDDPFKNASLWENDHVSDSSDSTSSTSSGELIEKLSPSPPGSTDISPDSFVAESFVNVESETPSYSPHTVETPVSESDYEPVVDPNEVIESLDVGDLELDLDASELELNDPGALDVSIETPTMEPETIDSDFSEAELSEAELEVEFDDEPEDSELAELDAQAETSVEVETNVEAEASDNIAQRIEETPTLAAELESELDSDSQLAPALDSVENVEDVEADEDTEEMLVSQDSGQDLLTDPPSESQSETEAQEESVYQGDWVAPPAESPSGTEQEAITAPSEQAGDDPTSPQTPAFQSLPTQIYPEYDWGQSTEILGSADQSVLVGNQLTAPLSSPQVLSEGYLPFAAGNPSLGGSAEHNPMLNPMLNYPPAETQPLDQFSDMVFDYPQETSPEESMYSDPLAMVEPSQSVDFPVQEDQSEAFGVYEPVCETPPTQAQPTSKKPQVADKSASPSQPPRSHLKARCPLYYSLAMGLSRLRLRSFKLCPCRHFAGCQKTGCQKTGCQKAGCQKTGCQKTGCQKTGCQGCQKAQTKAHRGLLKNWFDNHAPTGPKAAVGSKDLILQPQAFKPIGNLRNSLFKNSLQPSRGWLSGFYNGGNLFS